MLTKKLISVSLIAAMSVSLIGCSGSPVETNDTPATTSAAETTTAAEEETTTEAVTKEAASETAAETETETSAPESAEAPSNQELLRAVNEAFGIISDGSFTDDVDKAKAWRIIGEDEEIMADAPATPDFLISCCVRAASFADEGAGMDEIISIAVNRGIISDPDTSKIDMTKAYEIIKNAAHIWANSAFDDISDNSSGVTLQDNVVDLNGVITADEWWVEDDYIRMPPSAAEKIKGGDVFILPKKANGEGGAYKSSSVAIVNDEVYIKAEPNS